MKTFKLTTQMQTATESTLTFGRIVAKNPETELLHN